MTTAEASDAAFMADTQVRGAAVRCVLCRNDDDGANESAVTTVRRPSSMVGNGSSEKVAERAF